MSDRTQLLSREAEIQALGISPDTVLSPSLQGPPERQCLKWGMTHKHGFDGERRHEGDEGHCMVTGPIQLGTDRAEDTVGMWAPSLRKFSAMLMTLNLNVDMANGEPLGFGGRE